MIGPLPRGQLTVGPDFGQQAPVAPRVWWVPSLSPQHPDVPRARPSRLLYRVTRVWRCLQGLFARLDSGYTA